MKRNRSKGEINSSTSLSLTSLFTNFEKTEVPARTILLREGEISKRIFLLDRGCIRAYFNNDGKDATCQFFFEGSSVGSIESFRKKIPSPISLETIEPCILFTARRSQAELIFDTIDENKELRKHFLDLVFERTFDYMKLAVSFIRDSPEARYIHLMDERPDVIKRVPQHYIASYLGVTPVHLSRIKSGLRSKRTLPIR